ncbi:MAG: short-chain dehydrogenase [Methylophilales bacterium RIFCSPHIGHO2_02_FULL_57_10]|nr:MAG: short-chain dehydrogenase [Methylophilales bacterium RIFCSPHIGHO2_02_FULL_57_10]
MRVFITGASSGIGAALARYYASQGAQLGLAGRSRERLDAVVANLPCACTAYMLDVRDAAALQQAAQDFMQEYGTPDIVIANAGVSRGTLTEHAEDIPAFRVIMETNVLGMVHTFQPFLAAMREEGRGTLAGIASVAGLRGLPGAGAYAASKAAAISYLESLRVELVSSGISVITLCPGYIRTPMTAVNPYRMPFLMEADVAARKMARLIEHRKSFAILPWQMGLIGGLMRLLPAPVWDWAMKNAPRKPRLKWD